MGGFLTNVQVKLGKRGDDDKIITALRRTARAPIAVLRTPGWLAIYDSATEDQDLDKLDRLANRASEAASTPAVSVLVHDGDLLLLGLHRGGKLVDRRSSDGRAAGNATRWRTSLGVDPATLARAWAPGRRAVDALDALTRIARLLGWDADAALVGYKYLGEDAALSARAEELAFRVARPKAVTGAPRFQVGRIMEEVRARVGEQIPLWPWFDSVGGDGTGVTVHVGGSLIEDGLAAVEELVLEVQGEDGESARVFPDDDTTRFPSFRFPGQRKKAPRMALLIHARALAAGSGTIDVRIAPLADATAGVAYRSRIEIR